MPDQRRITKRYGAALVEFAIVMPVIFVFFTGIIEISRVLMLQHSVDTAAYEGARSAMVPGATAADAETAARKLLKAANLKGAKITVDPPTISEETSVISVDIDLPVRDNTWLPPIWITSGVVRSSVSLIAERPPVVQLTGMPTMKAKNTSSKVKGLAL